MSEVEKVADTETWSGQPEPVKEIRATAHESSYRVLRPLGGYSELHVSCRRVPHGSFSRVPHGSSCYALRPPGRRVLHGLRGSSHATRFIPPSASSAGQASTLTPQARDNQPLRALPPDRYSSTGRKKANKKSKRATMRLDPPGAQSESEPPRKNQCSPS